MRLALITALLALPLLATPAHATKKPPRWGLNTPTSAPAAATPPVR